MKDIVKDKLLNNKVVNRLYSNYLDPHVIFAIDLFTSLISAVFVLLFVVLIVGSKEYYSGPFAIWWMAGALAFSALSIYLFKTYRLTIRHQTFVDLRKPILSILFASILQGLFISFTCILNITVVIAVILYFLFALSLFIFVRFILLDIYNLFKSKVREIHNFKRILVYGTAEESIATITRFSNSSHYQLVGFLSRNPSNKKIKISGHQVYSFKNEAEFDTLVTSLSLSAILFSKESDVRAEEEGVIKYCSDSNIKALIIPTVDEIIDGKIVSNIRKVKIEDLLGRPEIKISLDDIQENFHGKVVMVTGAAGSIGSELCRQLAKLGVKQLILFDCAETPMHELRLELEARFPELNFKPVIGSVRHNHRIDYAFRKWKPQVVFHAAAYKHVPLMEENPCEAVLTNVVGTRMIADKCIEYGVEKMVMISTDKAVNPTNIMGCSKRLAEIYVQSLGLSIAKGEVKGTTKFITTRFGNVLGSNGSVIPRFREQIANGGPVTVTHPEITRFFMTIPEACRLVMEAATISSGNQICVFDMGESVKIVELAEKMIKLSGLKLGEDIQIAFTGLRPGEKLYEEVLANSENTEPTSHERIRIAKVREYSYSAACSAVDRLTQYALDVSVPDMVKCMKMIVPEFKSENSKFEMFDKIGENNQAIITESR